MLNILQSKRFVKFQITEIDDDVQVATEKSHKTPSSTVTTLKCHFIPATHQRKVLISYLMNFIAILRYLWLLQL